jgi:transposase
LERLPREGPQAPGWSNQPWTAKRVAAPILRHFGVLYHPEHVRKLLKHRLHWSSQKPQRRARERNDKEVGWSVG